MPRDAVRFPTLPRGHIEVSLLSFVCTGENTADLPVQVNDFYRRGSFGGCIKDGPAHASMAGLGMSPMGPPTSGGVNNLVTKAL